MRFCSTLKGMTMPYQLLDQHFFTSQFSKRARDAHKGNFGHVLVIGGDLGMPGAVRLAAEAALRVGAGLVSVATRCEHVNAVVNARPELMCHGIHKARELSLLLNKATVIAIGPGLGKSTWSRDLFQAAMTSSHPKIIDADALNLLTENATKSSRWILTPHLGEAARLLQCMLEEVQSNRGHAIAQLQQDYEGVVVLKGAGTLIADGKTIAECIAGNPGMASGGMGDVLTGVIAGLVAQGFSLENAAKTGVLLHAMAGDAAAATLGERGLLALDLMQHLHRLVNP